jgi:hypothetical protein
MKYLLPVALLCLAATLPAAAQPGSGKRYGTRDPKTCASRKEPANGAPSAAQAVAYFNCTMEGFFGDKLTLVENVKIEVGSGRRFLRSDSELKEIDPQYLIYPIRGSFDKYFCSRWPEYRAGFPDKSQPNCLLSHPRNTTGVCYKTSFGDWKCEMGGNTSPSDWESTFGPR